jgi:hypothetical protein
VQVLDLSGKSGEPIRFFLRRACLIANDLKNSTFNQQPRSSLPA